MSLNVYFDVHFMADNMGIMDKGQKLKPMKHNIILIQGRKQFCGNEIY